jgi:hypothetical protein
MFAHSALPQRNNEVIEMIVKASFTFKLTKRVQFAARIRNGQVVLIQLNQVC